MVTGTKGFLDIKGIYYQSGDFATGGVVFFDDTGLQRSTNAPAAPVITSKQILTAITKNTLTLGANITAATGDIIRQDSTCLMMSPVAAVIFAPRVKVFLVIAVKICLEVITGAAGAFVDL